MEQFASLAGSEVVLTPHRLCISFLICYFVRKQQANKSKLGGFLIRIVSQDNSQEPQEQQLRWEKSWDGLSSCIQRYVDTEANQILSWLSRKVKAKFCLFYTPINIFDDLQIHSISAPDNIEDTMDMMEGMVDKLEETDNMAEKIRLHSEISKMTKSIKNLIDNLIKDVDEQKIVADSSTIFADDLDPNGQYDVLDNINNLDTELENMDKIDDLRQKVDIYIQLQKKCHVLKQSADNGDLVIRKCN